MCIYIFMHWYVLYKLDQTSMQAADQEDGYKHSPSVSSYVHNL